MSNTLRKIRPNVKQLFVLASLRIHTHIVLRKNAILVVEVHNTWVKNLQKEDQVQSSVVSFILITSVVIDILSYILYANLGIKTLLPFV